MTVDATKIGYSSGWDIDQLTATNSANPTTVAAGSTAIYTISGAVSLPDFKVQFKPTGSTYWFEPGTSSTDGTVANEFTFSIYINAGSIYITTSSGGQARYFVWADKIDY